MNEQELNVMKTAKALIKDLAGCYTVEEANQHVEQARGYCRAITDHHLVPFDARAELEGDIHSARRTWTSVKATVEFQDEIHTLFDMIKILPDVRSSDELFKTILSAKMLIGHLQSEGALSDADAEGLSERVQLTAATAGKRFGIEDPVKALQEQEPRNTVVTVREALQSLQTVPDEHLDLPLVCENDTFYFDCSSTWELTTRDRRTHSWAEKNEPEPVILI